MLSLPDRAAIESALNQPLPPGLHSLIVDRLSQEMGGHSYDLTDLTHIVVVEPGETAADIQRELNVSPSSEPVCDLFQVHDGWFEVVAIVGNDGFAFVLFIQDDPATDPELLALCRACAARKADHLI